MRRIERGGHVLPFEDLHALAMRTWHVGMFLGAFQKAFCDSATGRDERRAEHLKIFASAMALQRESAWVSGSPALFISHLAMSSCMAALIVTWLNDAGLFAPVISNRERPSRRSL